MAQSTEQYRLNTYMYTEIMSLKRKKRRKCSYIKYQHSWTTLHRHTQLYIYIYTSKHIYTHTPQHPCTHTLVHTHTHYKDMYVCGCVCVCVCVCVRVCACACVCVCVSTHVYVCVCIHKREHKWRLAKVCLHIYVLAYFNCVTTQCVCIHMCTRTNTICTTISQSVRV